MKTLLPILIASLFFAYLTEITTVGQYGKVRQQSSANKLFFFLLFITLAMPAGLRYSYNDTGNYIRGFQSGPLLPELLTSGELHILENPAFEVYRALVRTLTSNYHIFLLIPSFFIQYSYISFIRRYCSSFTMGIAIYFLFGTYVFSFAAMKQAIAMAILLFAIPRLLERKYLQFYLLVFIAFLFHTYAISFAILPLFMTQPWKLRTFLVLFIALAIMVNFQSVIGSFLDAANDSGKTVADYEVFDNNQINILRVLVYAVVPLMSFFLRGYLFRGKYDESYNLLIHMAVISFAIMLLGTINGANMFGRMAQYFEFGIICSLPWMITRSFEPRSARTVTVIALSCFFFYFFYANQINMSFDDAYRAVTFLEFIQSLF